MKAVLALTLTLATLRLGAQEDQVRVGGSRELPAALRSGNTVLLVSGEYLLSEVAQVANPAVSWEATFDGPQMVITGVNNLTLKAERGATLLASPRYAYTLVFRGCRDLRLEGLTLGHTEAGECDGGVLRFEGCSGVRVEGCDLFGSGVLGLDLEDCTGVTVYDSTIRECTLGALYATGVQGLRLDHVRLTGNGAWPLVSLDSCRDVVLESCRIADNAGDGLFWIGPDSEEVALPHTTISGIATGDLLYEGSRVPDFSTTVFLENRFGNPLPDEEDWEYDEGDEGDYTGE